MADGKKVVMQVVVEFDKSLLSRFDVSGWNHFVQNLMAHKLIPPMWVSDERPSPLGVLLDFSGLQRMNYRLDGIDLSMCWLENADFTGASLKNAQLGCGRNVSYRACRLYGADFTGIEISGCDFSDATGMETALWDGAVFDPANPPKGLPENILAKCLPDASPPPENPREPRNPQEPTGFTVMPLKCVATIHTVPVEE